MFLSIWDVQQDPFFEHDKEIDEQDNDRFITILPTKQMFQMLAVEWMNWNISNSGGFDLKIKI